MTAPRMNRRLTLETPVSSDDGAGGIVRVWQTLGTVWAEVTPRSGRERRGITGAVSDLSYRITLRAAPPSSLARPKPEQRFRDGARLFNIHAVTERDASGLYVVCFADEEVVA
jgi:SPP1 family predicted phage head-tail adaptor